MQDKGGHVRKETLIKIIKQDFGLTIDIEVCAVLARNHRFAACSSVSVPQVLTWHVCGVLCEQELINEIDTDGSGEIEYDEFKQLLS